MGLEEHELEGWEGPTGAEVGREVAVEVLLHLVKNTCLESSTLLKFVGILCCFLCNSSHNTQIKRGRNSFFEIYICAHTLAQAARVVITWLNKVRETEDKQKLAESALLTLDSDGSNEREGGAEGSEEDDEDLDEFVYDIQVY